jgi:hypothetical protein
MASIRIVEEGASTLGEKVQMDGENFIVRNFTLFTLHQIILS